MDFFLDQNNLWILLAALVSGGMLLWPNLRRGQTRERIDLAEAIRQLNQEHGVLVDLRPPEAFRAGTIPQARNIPLAALDAQCDKLPKDKPIVLFDEHGRNTGRAVGALRKQGFDRVSSLQGGLASWTQGGLPLKKS